jgi:hypothetical protein
MKRVLLMATVMRALAASPAWADHGVGRPPGNPVLEAVIWAGAAFVVGVAVVAVVAVLSRKKRPSE